MSLASFFSPLIVSVPFSTVMSMSSRDMSGSSAFSTSSLSPDWKMSTGGTHVLAAANPKSRNGSQRTMVMMALLYFSLLRLRVVRVDHFGILHVRTLRTFRTLRTLRTLVELFRHRMRRALQICGRSLVGRHVV